MVTFRHAGMKFSSQYKFQITVKISETTSFALKSMHVDLASITKSPLILQARGTDKKGIIVSFY